VVFVTDRFWRRGGISPAATDYNPDSGIQKSGDWWTLDAAYVVINLTLAAVTATSGAC